MLKKGSFPNTNDNYTKNTIADAGDNAIALPVHH